MIFSKNLKEDLKVEILALWGNRGIQQYENYLGLSPIIRRSKKMAFSDIKTKLWKRLQV